ncbi:hypothetical protein GCM10009536_59750 [Streptomyces thermocarboxydus]
MTPAARARPTAAGRMPERRAPVSPDTPDDEKRTVTREPYPVAPPSPRVRRRFPPNAPHTREGRPGP